MTHNYSISPIILKYLEVTELSMRKFASELGISHAAISNWAAGKSIPDTDFLLKCKAAYSDWRCNFATDLLDELLPEVFVNSNGHQPQADPCEEGNHDPL
jgi:transcriptional regulator with XRE-family HTH domain